jgi:hypothetical protein
LYGITEQKGDQWHKQKGHGPGALPENWTAPCSTIASGIRSVHAGQRPVIAGFENAITGMNIGESKTAVIPVEQGYGPRRDDMIVTIKRDQLPPDLPAKVGQRLEITQTDDQVMLVTVTGVTESSITLDANHPLAGRSLPSNLSSWVSSEPSGQSKKQVQKPRISAGLGLPSSLHPSKSKTIPLHCKPVIRNTLSHELRIFFLFFRGNIYVASPADGYK